MITKEHVKDWYETMRKAMDGDVTKKDAEKFVELVNKEGTHQGGHQNLESLEPLGPIKQELIELARDGNCIVDLIGEFTEVQVKYLLKRAKNETN